MTQQPFIAAHHTVLWEHFWRPLDRARFTVGMIDLHSSLAVLSWGASSPFFPPFSLLKSPPKAFKHEMGKWAATRSSLSSLLQSHLSCRMGLVNCCINALICPLLLIKSKDEKGGENWSLLPCHIFITSQQWSSYWVVVQSTKWTTGHGHTWINWHHTCRHIPTLYEKTSEKQNAIKV